MTLVSAEAILASSTSKFGIRSPFTEHEDFRSFFWTMCTWGSWWAGHKKNTPDGTDIKAHQVTSWWWARETVGTRSASGCATKMRASGRTILLWCCVLELYFQSSQAVPWGECSSWSELDGSLCCSNRRNANEATSHDGSFDHCNVNQEHVEEWKRRHVCSLSKIVESRVLEKTTDVRPIVRYGSGSPQWWGARRRRQGTVRNYFIDSTDIVAAATTPRCAIEIACN